MKKISKRRFLCFAICASNILTVGCNKYSKFTIKFHIDDEVKEIQGSNDGYIVEEVNKENKRFIGWSTTQSKKDIVSTDVDVKNSSVENLFNKDNILELYAIYADVITVNFMLESPVTFTLDSDLKNNEKVPENNKEGSYIKGWALSSESNEITLKNDVYTVSYSNISPLTNGDSVINFYPIYKNTNVKLYKFSTNDEMAEIHIETDNHLAIDDSSLILQDEHKGKNGELPAYDYVGAKISVDHCEEQYVLDSVAGKVKVRGNYTSSYDKKPIRIKFDKKQKMLGLNKDNSLKSWVLLANWKDTSMLRDASAFYLANAILETDGFYASDFRFVKVYLNGSYNGVYLLVEQQQIDSARVNIAESKSEEDSEKTGYLLEYDGYYKNEPSNQRFTVSYNDVKNGNTGFTISNDIMNTAQYNFIKKVTQNIWKVVYDACKKSHTNLSTSPYHTIDDNGNYIEDKTITSSEEAVDKVMDTKSLVDMYLLHELLEDRDLGFSSFYFSIDFSENGNKKLTFNAPWDFDYAVGNSNFENALKATISTSKFKNEGKLDSTGKKFKEDTVLTKSDFTIEKADALYCKQTDNPWFVVFSDQQWLWNAVYERYLEAKQAKVFSSLLEMISTYTNKYSTYFNENFTKWPQSMGLKLSEYQPSIVTYFVTQKQASDFLYIWLEARIEGLGTALKNKAKA
ncbi:MAG: CotH kinase family protein [Bacilli bacterium]|nr:CotH kinase family protein [Bacilli bacterium]